MTNASQLSCFLGESSAGRPQAPLPQVQEALERIALAISAGETFAVYGDYDADGLTAAAVLTQGLRDLGGAVIPYIPDRFGEGYGLNTEALTSLRQAGATVLISADCGTSSIGELDHARNLGMDAVVLDHHVVPAVSAAPLALVNPKRKDSEYLFDDLASVGIAYRLMEGLYQTMGRQFPCERFLDLVAVGTVADVVPLVGENRDLVRAGLETLAAAGRPGLNALRAVAGLTGKTLDVESIAFGLAPRLNAAGRLAHGGTSFRLLITEDEAEAKSLAQSLDSLNHERQRLTEQAMSLAAAIIEDGRRDQPLLFLGHREMHVGIVGLVAGRLAEETGRPAVVYSEGQDESRGSARSVAGLDITAALRHVGHLMVRFGGHSMAAGFTARNEMLPALGESLGAYAADLLAGKTLGPVLTIDAQVDLREIKGEEIRWLQRIQPCGAGNPNPVLLSRNVLVLEARPMGRDARQHLRMKLKDGPVTWWAAHFRRNGLGRNQPASPGPAPGQYADIVYSLVQGRARDSLELRLHDLAPAG